MADLSKEFEAEQDLSKEFEAEKSLDGGASSKEKASSLLELLKARAGDMVKAHDAALADTVNTVGAPALAATLGGLKSMSGNFLDEIAGGGATALDVLKDPEKLDKWREIYRQHQQEASKYLKDVEAQSPVASKVGEVGGFVLPALLTAGASLPATAAQGGLRAIGKQALLPYMAKQGLKTGALGALTGAIQQTGASEHNLDSSEEAQKLAGDAIGGAIGGGLVGGTLGAGLAGVGNLVGKGLNAFDASLPNHPFLRQLMQSRDMGKAGESLNQSPQALSRMAKEQQDAIRQFTEMSKAPAFGTPAPGGVGPMAPGIGQKIGDAVSKATKKGITIPIDQDFKRAADDIIEVLKVNRAAVGSSDVDMLIGQLDRIKGMGSDINPTTAMSLVRDIEDKVGGLNKPEFSRIAQNFSRSVRDKVESAIPGLKDLSRQYHDYLSAVPETLIQGSQIPEYADLWLGNLKNKDLAISKSVSQLLNKLRSPGTNSMEATTVVNNLKDTIAGFEKKYPGELAKYGFPNADKLVQELSDKADKFAIHRAVLGNEPRGKIGMVDTLTNAVNVPWRGKAFHTANVVGKAEKVVSDLGKKFFGAPDDALLRVAGTIDSTRGPSAVTSALRKAIAEKNTATKNAIMFTIMQNPDMRTLISGDDIDGTAPQSNTDVTDEFNKYSGSMDNVK